MTRFRYRATDADGKAFVDSMEAESARKVTARLRERGLTVNSVMEVDKPRGFFRVSKQLNWEELHLFTQQLYAITRTSLPLPAALKSLAADLKSSRLKPVLESIQKDVEQGVSLDAAIDKQYEAFPSLFADVIKAGEATGNLSGVLQIYLHHTERMLALKGTLKTSLAYPLVVVLLGMLIMGFLLVKVVPVFAEIFTEFGGDLPAPTKFWVNMGDVVLYDWPMICLSITGTIMTLYLIRRLMERFERGRIRLDWLRLHTPIIGRIRYLHAVSRFSRTLAMLLASRVPVLPSLELAAAASGSPLLQNAVGEANLRVAGGERIADALAGSGFFAYHFCWLLGMGEDRGEAELALESAAETMEGELLSRDRVLGSTIAPVIIIIVGLLIASLVVSLYLPIFTLGDAISM